MNLYENLGIIEERIKTMYFYRLGYWSYEDSSDTTLIHEHQFTDEEFHSMIKEAFINCTIQKIENLDSIMMGRITSRAEAGMTVGFDTYSSVSNDVVEYLKENYGFDSPEYSCEHFVDGWTSFLQAINFGDDLSTPHSYPEQYSMHLGLRSKFLEKFGWVPEKQWKEIFIFENIDNPEHVLEVEYRYKDEILKPYVINGGYYAEHIDRRTIVIPGVKNSSKFKLIKAR